jgi:hypothetical protein
MRQRGLLLGLIVAGASFAMEAPTASSHEMERFPVRLAAFLPRSPLPLDFKPTSMNITPDVAVFLERAMAGAKARNFAEP